MMQTIFLIRHGESEWNREGRVQGHRDSALSELGVEQAKRIGERLKRERIDHVVSSTASRALDTCRLALGPGADVERCEHLREINLGVWEGQKPSELRLVHAREVDMWYSTPSRVRIEGGETLRAFRMRVTREMNRLRKEHDEKALAVFTHGGVICTYLTSLLGMKLDDLWRFKIRNGSVTMIIFQNDQPRIALLGDVHHLDGAERIDTRTANRFFP